MEQLSEDLWVAESSLRFAGVRLGTRMTVIRLASGELVLISPIAPSHKLRKQVEAHGTVTHLIAPNKLHHLFIGEWGRLYPDAFMFVAPGLETKRPELGTATVLKRHPEAVWAGELDQVVVEGLPFINEVVFFHPASRSLVLTDLAFNVGRESPALTRFAFRLAQGYGRLTPSLLERLLCRDRVLLRACLKRILDWPFERVIVAHGSVCEAGGREQLTNGYRWAL